MVHHITTQLSWFLHYKLLVKDEASFYIHQLQYKLLVKDGVSFIHTSYFMFKAATVHVIIIMLRETSLKKNLSLHSLSCSRSCRKFHIIFCSTGRLLRENPCYRKRSVTLAETASVVSVCWNSEGHNPPSDSVVWQPDKPHTQLLCQQTRLWLHHGSVSCLMRTTHARFLSDTIHYPTVTSKSLCDSCYPSRQDFDFTMGLSRVWWEQRMLDSYRTQFTIQWWRQKVCVTVAIQADKTLTSPWECFVSDENNAC